MKKVDDALQSPAFMTSSIDAPFAKASDTEIDLVDPGGAETPARRKHSLISLEKLPTSI